MFNILKQPFKYFLIGVLAIIPIVVVVQVVLVTKSIFESLFFSVYGKLDNYLFTFIVFAVVVMALTYIGYNLVQSKRSLIISSVDLLMDKVPLLNSVYRISKKVINIFTGSDSEGKKEVVYIEYPKDGIWVPAYVTNKSADWYVLFVPTSPNPTSGFTVLVHETRVIKSLMSIEDATSFIISVGADFPNAEEIQKLRH
jgi:uncharacterized membrane protein